MKILYCKTCKNLVKLTRREVRFCDCGRVQGRYLRDGRKAEIFLGGPAISIVISTPTWKRARHKVEKSLKQKRDLSRKDYKKVGKLIAWVRPNSGKGNPHTRLREKPFRKSQKS
jgi:hypothetical protein